MGDGSALAPLVVWLLVIATAAAVLWLVALAALFGSHNRQIRSISGAYVLLGVLAGIVWLASYFRERVYFASANQELQQDMVIDGIPLPKGAKLTVQPVKYGKQPDFAAFSKAEFAVPLDWHGVKVAEMEHVAHDDGIYGDGIYGVYLKTRQQPGHMPIEGWYCDTGEPIAWRFADKSGRKPVSPADYRLDSCSLAAAVEQDVPWLGATLKWFEVERSRDEENEWAARLMILPPFGTVWLEQNRITKLDLLLDERSAAACPPLSGGERLQWDARQADIVRIETQANLPPSCWGKQLLRAATE